MTDSLASLREMLNGPSVAAGITQPAPVPRIQLDPLNAASLTPTKATTPVALPIKKKLDTFTIVLVSGGVLLCIYVYYKYFRKPAPLKEGTRHVPHSAQRAAKQQERPVPAKAKHVRFSEDVNNNGPTLEEIHDDSDLVQAVGKQNAASHVRRDDPQEAKTVPLKQTPDPPVKQAVDAPPLKQADDLPGPKTVDSKDPNFQVVPPAEDSDL